MALWHKESLRILQCDSCGNDHCDCLKRAE
jgi:hypothetical protein